MLLEFERTYDTVHSFNNLFANEISTSLSFLSTFYFLFVKFKINITEFQSDRASVAQSVYRLATGWTTEGSELESRNCQECSLLHTVHTSSGANSASYRVDTGALTRG
jgi:hypothetical protein